MRRLAHRVGHRGSALLFFALLDLIYCISLLFPPERTRRTESFLFLAAMLPLWVWAALWGAVGAVCLVFAFRRRDQPGFASAIGIKVLWAGVYLGGWIAGHLERGYVSAVVWGALAALAGLLSSWPEPPERGARWTRL
jgi:predicted MFS family arabinose efflux permease